MANSPDITPSNLAYNSPLGRYVSRRRALGLLVGAATIPLKLFLPETRKAGPPSLPELATQDDFQLGMSVETAESWNNPSYMETVVRNANIVVPNTQFSQKTVDQLGPDLAKPFVKLVANDNMTLRVRDLFEPWDIGKELQGIIDDPPSDFGAAISDFMRRRTHGVLQVVKDSLAEIGKTPKDIKLEVVVADSALRYLSDGSVAWYDVPYEAASEDLWITDAYVFTEEAVRDLGFREDTRFSYSDYKIEVPSKKGTYVRGVLKTVKEQVGNRLGRDPQSVQLDVCMKGRLRDRGLVKDNAVDESQLIPTALKEYWSLMAREVGPVMYGQTDYYGSDYESMRRTVALLTESSLDVGPDIARGITFWAPLKLDNLGYLRMLVDPISYEPLDLHSDLTNIFSSR